MNNDILTLLLVLAPATLVLAATYMVLKRMLEADQRRRQVELRINTHNDTVKIRLHAIEQLVVFVEHLSPVELLLRTTRNVTTAGELQALLSELIRTEMNNSLPYQVYVSIDTWQLVVNTRNSVQSIINIAAAALGPDEPAFNLSRKIIENVQQEQALPGSEALEALRKETKLLFA